MTGERWAAIAGLEGVYEVSDAGRVRALSRFVRSRHKAGVRKLRERLLAIQVNPVNGYLSVMLSDGGRSKKMSLHRAVAIAFIPNPGARPQVNHRDGVKGNNAVENLEWCTGSENCMHALREGLYASARGERIAHAKLREADIVEIRQLAAVGTFHREIAASFGVGRKTITKIVNRQRWGHVA